jgi:putative DNA methylase
VGQFRDVRRAIHNKVADTVNELYKLGFRGADLLTACFGQAVNEFGRYEFVEKGSGERVTVEELLTLVRESAFTALLKGFDGDDFSKFYIGWLQLYGFTESDFDDAAKFTKVGLSIEVKELFQHHIFIKNGNKQTLAGYRERNQHIKQPRFLIDVAHLGMDFYQGKNRHHLLQFIAEQGPSLESPFWRIIASLCSVLPAGSDDHRQATGLQANRDSLIRDAKNLESNKTDQLKLEF